MPHDTPRLIVTGTGSYLPERVVTNDELAQRMETSDSWIRERTGIGQRHLAEPGETTSMMALEAGRRALEMARCDADEIDQVIVATLSPDYSFPSVAGMVQAGLGMTRGSAFDMQAACSGFLYALQLARFQLLGGSAKKILVIGAERFSSFIDWEDRGTCVLFGDGAGAVVLEATTEPGSGGLLDTLIYSDGRHLELLRATGGISTTGTAGNIHMQGREVFRHAARAMAQVVEEILTRNDLQRSDVTWLVPHQANSRIIEATAKLLHMPMEQVILTIEDHANTSAASIPLALDAANRAGRFKAGDLLFMEAFGAGFTWAGGLLRWGA